MKTALWMLVAWTLGTVALVLCSDVVTETVRNYITNGPW
jgi:hypothetical protein